MTTSTSETSAPAPTPEPVITATSELDGLIDNTAERIKWAIDTSVRLRSRAAKLVAEAVEHDVQADELRVALETLGRLRASL